MPSPAQSPFQGALGAFGGAGIGSMIGGIFGNQETNNALSAASRNAIAKQNAAIRQGYGVFEGSLPGQTMQAANQQIGQGAANRMQGYNQLISNPLVPNLPSNPNQGVDNAKLGVQANAQANLGGYSDWQLNQLISQIRTKQQLDQISDFARGNAALTPFTLNAAQHAGDAAKGIGGLVDMAAMFGALI